VRGIFRAFVERGYRVSSDDDNANTRYYTICLSVEQAKAVADKLNADIPHNMLPQ
jgi:hypothetical protein